MRILHDITELILNAVFPRYCLQCNALGAYLCKPCSKRLIPIEFQRCIVCQQRSERGTTHAHCITGDAPDRLITCFSYHNPIVKSFITRGKLMLIPELFSVLVQAAIKTVQVTHNINPFTITPIPISKAKERFRGFNQSAIIAMQLQAALKIPSANLLIKRVFIKQQKLLNKSERQSNIKKAFIITNSVLIPSHVLLIDDVTTSGATFLAAARVLKQAGAQTVWCFALAQD